MQTNGLDERFNQTLKCALEKYVNEESQDDWDEVLDGILFAYRKCGHKSTKASPFFVMFNRKPRLPIELEIPSSIHGEEPTDVAEFIEGMLKIRRQVHGKVKHNIKATQRTQKKYYDARHAPEVMI